MKNEPITDVERFWRKVDRRGSGDCWPWRGGINSHGYGNFWINKRTVHAHAVALRFSGETIPEGFQALHSCDVRSCCNPAHLRVGTLQDNKRDETDRMRHVHGETHHAARLTDNDVRQIRSLGESGLSLAEIGRQFSMTGENAGHIIRRHSWRHVL